MKQVFVSSIKGVLTGSWLLAATVSTADAAQVNEITLWTRHKGAYSDDQNPTKGKPRSVDIEAGKLVERRMFDAQYGKTALYKGVPLAHLLAAYKPTIYDDLALLHFANGMLVPVPLDPAVIQRLDAFVATEICESKASCSKEFPDVAKDDAFTIGDDPRPIKFSWNKLVVPTLWHPAVPESREHIFTPWHHVDTLTGVEFVNSAAYYAQFDLGEADGQKVFTERCQFCHGVRYVGARYGWDYVAPLPIYEKRPPEQLLNHVKYPKALAKKMGLMMPTQADVTVEEMQAIWRWMRKAANRSLPHYNP